MVKRADPVRRSLGERIDSAIMTAFPGWGMRRMEARVRHRLCEAFAQRTERSLSARQNEAASHDRLRGGRWMASRLSPDSGAELELADLQMRVEELYRNEGYARSYVDGRVDNEVGCGLTPQSRIKEGDGLTRDQAKLFSAAIEDLYERWQRKAGRRGEAFWTIQRLADRDLARFGEAFVLITDQAPDDDVPVPLVLEVIYPGRIATPPKMINDGLCRLGVQRDKNERVTGYWVRQHDPGDTKGDGGARFDFVPVAKAGQSGWAMVHIFEAQFAGQTRGLPDLAPVMNDLRDLKDVQESTRIAMQIEACLVAFVTNAQSNPTAAAMANASGVDGTGNRLEEFRPGTIHYGNTGEDVKFLAPTRPGSAFAAFTEWCLRGIGAGVGYCYNLLARDWSKVNYSSGRLALIDARKNFSCRRKLLIERLCLPVWTRLVDEGLIAGVLEFDPTDYAADPYRFQRCQWIGDRQEWVDPSSEVQAATDAIAGGLDSKTNNIMSRGMDPEDLQQQLEREDELDVERRKKKNEAEKAAGLTPSEAPPEAAAPDAAKLAAILEAQGWSIKRDAEGRPLGLDAGEGKRGLAA